jgi:protein-S-isoprenylcysteine O-methyltransferase Ste14
VNGLVLSTAIWVAWLLYWLYASRAPSTPAEREGTPSRLLHLSLMATGFLLLLVQPLTGSALLNYRWLAAGEVTLLFGLLVETGGFVLAVWARRHPGLYWSGSIQLKDSHRVVGSGPYAWVRHPIYAGVLLAMLGTAIVGGTIQGLIAAPLMLVAYLRKIGLEERLLLRSLGGDYAAYRKEVRALIPFVL